MSFIPVGFAEAVLEFSIPGDAGPALVVIGVDPGGSQNTQQTADNIADTMNNTPGFMDPVSIDVTFEGVTVYEKIAAGVTQIATNSTSQAGRQAGDIEPPQVAVLVQKSTGLAGRSNRGRMYVPGPVAAAVESDGRLTTTYQGQVQTAMNAFLADLSTNLAPMVLLHADPAATPTTVTSLVVQSKVATQRRRLR